MSRTQRIWLRVRAAQKYRVHTCARTQLQALHMMCNHSLRVAQAPFFSSFCVTSARGPG